MLTNNDDFVTEFERRLSEFTGAPHVVAVDRCTNALLLCAKVCGVSRVTIPTHTYLSVPMTLHLHGIEVSLKMSYWRGMYELGDTNIYDCAVGFEQNMYRPSTYMCLSFQQKKRLAIGKGGAILLDNPHHAAILRRMRHDGRVSSKSVVEELAEDPYSIQYGYHAYMSPDEAAKGILLLNQLSPSYNNGWWGDYPDLTNIPCLNNLPVLSSLQ